MRMGIISIRGMIIKKMINVMIVKTMMQQRMIIQVVIAICHDDHNEL